MKIEGIYFIRTALQILSLCIIIYSIQYRSKSNSVKAGINFFLLYSLNCFLELNRIYPTYVFIIMTLSTIVLISLLYKKDFIDALIDYSVFLIVFYPLGLIAELIPVLLSPFGIKLSFSTNEYHLVIYMLTLLILSILICLLIPLKALLDKFRIFLRRFYLILASMFVFYFITKEDFAINSNKSLTIILAYIAIVLLNIFLFKEFWIAKERQSLIKQHNLYIKSIEPLIADIRSKQHDFKNHLTTLNNLCMLGDNDNKATITSYISSINKQISEIDNFVYSSNKVVGVILYSKSRECALKGIDFVYKHPVYELVFPLEDFEFTSVLGNLIDNAIYAVENSDMDTKKICVEMGEENGKKFFSVSNTGNPIPFNDIPKLFAKGYTTKEDKKSHGFGLYNVKKIISKYNGSIDISNNQPYVTFKISF